MKDPFLLWLLVGLLFIGISIPLIFAKVPPNRWYGFRVSKTLLNKRVWYAANRVAGYDLLWAGSAIAATAVITELIFNQIGSTTAFTINMSMFIGTLAIAAVHSFLNLKQL